MKNAQLFALILLGLILGLALSSTAQEVPKSRAQIAFSFAPLVKQAAPAVVNIYAQHVMQQRNPMMDDPFFQQYMGGAMAQGMDKQRMENSLGSGVIVRGDGLIVTSSHVVGTSGHARVQLSDRREFDATVIAADEHSDLAILKIDTQGARLPYLELSDSDQAQTGDLVLAIGNPFGVGQTVTNGIISAITHRNMGGGSGDLDYFLQTDAAINPGNSGGALISMDGKLVGINSTIFSRSGGNMGIGFAVPSNMVRVVLNAVEHGQKNVVRPWLGMSGQQVTPEIATSLGMAQPAGVLVSEVQTSGPAAIAGIRSGDVVIGLNGKHVEDGQTFHYRISTMPVGSDVTLTVLRKGQKLDLAAHLIAPPNDPNADWRVGLQPGREKMTSMMGD